MRAKRIAAGPCDAKAQVPWNGAKGQKNGPEQARAGGPCPKLFLSKCHHIGAAQATIGKRDFSTNMTESGALVDLEQERFGACRIRTTLNQAENPGSGSASEINRATGSRISRKACSRINCRTPLS